MGFRPIFDRPLHRCNRRQMETPINPRHRVQDGQHIGRIGNDQANPFRQAIRPAGGEIIENGHPMALVEQSCDEMRADKTCAARNQIMRHDGIPLNAVVPVSTQNRFPKFLQ